MVDWDAWRQIGLSIDILSGVFFLAFGLFVWLKRPRTAAGLAAGVFAVGLSIAVIVPNVVLITDADSDSLELVGTSGAIAHVGQIVGLGLVFIGGARLVHIEGMRRRAWPMLALAAIAGLGSAVDVLASDGLASAAEAGSVLFAASLTAFLLWIVCALDSSTSRRHLTRMALAPYAMTWSMTRPAEFLARGEVAPPAVMVASVFVGLLIIGTDRGASRVFAWAAMWGAAAAIWGWAFAAHHPSDLGLSGASRIVAVTILGFAVVRHRAFDIDIKVRFVLRQSTVAAAFVAAFVGIQFLVSEWIGATWGLAAGALSAAGLVFVLGPLQRAAERLAATALPDARPLAERTDADRAALYAALVKEAWSDGHVTAKELKVLDTARERLGLSLEEAHAIDTRARG